MPTEPSLSFTQRRLSLYQRTYGTLTYTELSQLVKELDSTISYLPVDDPAFSKLTQDRRAFLLMMELLNEEAELKRFDHCRPLRMLCAVGDDVFEQTFQVSRLLWKPNQVIDHIKGRLRNQHKGVVIEVELIDYPAKEKGLW